MGSNTSKHRVAHLTSAHPPFDIRIFHKECKTLAKAGYEVHLVAPHGGDAVVDGVRIHGIRKAQSRRDRLTRTCAAAYEVAQAIDAELYHFHDPELIGVGFLLKAAGRRVVYDVHEDLPRDILAKTWIAPWIRRPISIAAATVEAIAGRIFDGIVVATPTIYRRFPPGKTVLAQNFPILSEFAAGMPRRRQLVYAGVISKGRGFPEIIDALMYLPPDVHLVLAGSFDPPELEEELRVRPGWSKVRYMGWVDRSQVVQLLGSSSVGLLIYRPDPNNIAAQPHKLFEYMAAGLPVVASDFPLWRRIIENAGCGVVVNPRDPEQISHGIAALLNDETRMRQCGASGQRCVRERYNWAIEAERLLEVYRRILE